MRVYVGIVTYNSLPDLPECFAALERQTHPDLRVIVWDNASTDGTRQWLRQYQPSSLMPIITLISDDNRGYGRGHNALIKAVPLTPQDGYLALNPDVRLCPAYIQRLVESAARHGAGWAVGKLLLPEGAYLYSAGHALRRDGYAINIGHGQPDVGQFDLPREVFGAPGAAALYLGHMIHALAPGGDLFEPTFFMYGEDTDLDWRARCAGYRCWYDPTATASHRGSRPEIAMQMEAVGNRYLSVLKNAYPFDLLTYNLPLIFAHCLARIAISPRWGLYLARHILRSALPMLRKRTRPALRRKTMLAWFAWSQQQPSAQPRRWYGRIRAAGQKGRHP